MKTASTIVAVPLALSALLGCGPGAADAAMTAQPADPSAAMEPVILDELPLDRGYYVRTDETCAQASPAGVHLLRRAGLQWVTSHCLFDRIEQTGPSTYRVAQSCGDPSGTEAAIAIYEIADSTSFAFRDEHGWEHAARLCPQRDLPAPWRDEDLRDLID